MIGLMAAHPHTRAEDTPMGQALLPDRSSPGASPGNANRRGLADPRAAGTARRRSTEEPNTAVRGSWADGRRPKDADVLLHDLDDDDGDL